MRSWVYRRPPMPRQRNRAIGALTFAGGTQPPTVEPRPPQVPHGTITLRHADPDPLLRVRPWAESVRTIRRADDQIEKKSRELVEVGR